MLFPIFVMSFLVCVEKQNGEEPIAYRPPIEDGSEENYAGENRGWGGNSSSSESDNDELSTVVKVCLF